MQRIEVCTIQKVPRIWNTFVSYIRSWCGIKDDHRTLAELEGVDVVNLYTDTNEKDDKPALDKVIDEMLSE